MFWSEVISAPPPRHTPLGRATSRDARGRHLVGDRNAAAAVEDNELEKGDRRERGEQLEHRVG